MEAMSSSNWTGDAPEYLKLYEFEKHFNHDRYSASLERNWSWILYLSAVYALLVRNGQRWMADRKPFQLKRALIAWNFSLAFFSVAVFVRMLPELVWQLNNTGFQDSLCHFGRQKSLSQLWGVIFGFSKVFEFGDTAFLVLTKKPIIFLHWYHHATVAIYGFFVGDINDPASRWFVLVNSFVHMIMYSYYGLKAMRVKIPRKISIAITGMQMSQMVFGIYINIITSSLKASGIPCERSYRNIEVASVMYATYLILFANFFYKSYVTKTSRKLKLKSE